MRILITTDTFAPVINGVVTSVKNLKSGLEAEGHDVRILTLSNRICSYSLDKVWYIGSISADLVYPQARVGIPAPFRIIREIIAWKPDVVHSQSEMSTMWLARIIARRCSVPLIHTYHTVYEDYTHYLSLNRVIGLKMAEMVSRSVLNKTNAVIVPTEKVKEILLRYGVNKPVFIVPTGIHPEYYHGEKHGVREKLREKFGIQPEEALLLYVGRLGKEKNIGELLSLLSDYKPHPKLLIVGGGPDQKNLQEAARTAGMSENILFAGMIAHEKIPDYYAAGDIFVSASESESQGLTYIEAMASGLPLLCKKDDCLCNVVENGKNGFTWDSREEFYSHLDRLISNPQLRKQIGYEAMQSVKQKYTVLGFSLSCIEIYQKMIQSYHNSDLSDP